MAADLVLEDEEENILYDLLINTEWPAETDTQVCRRTVCGCKDGLILNESCWFCSPKYSEPRRPVCTLLVRALALAR